MKRRKKNIKCDAQNTPEAHLQTRVTRKVPTYLARYSKEQQFASSHRSRPHISATSPAIYQRNRDKREFSGELLRTLEDL
ncbi:hypothetical protein CEXT_656821 [Caerostris extrusa]|uniref:Uncharacterized protein n=1 Tax=Caerostris extrusa TaxID=172846 RepID=A0AAV4NZ86_CAEEX|nr:hypothetical protein CEXT_656821 [Caerostris extrusa]